MKYLKIFIITILTLTGIRSFGQTDVENEIISSLIKSQIKPLPNDTVFTRKGEIKEVSIHIAREIILINETEAYLFNSGVDSLETLKTKGLPSIDNDSYLNFIECNKSKIQIDSIPNFKGTITYISQNELDNIFKQGGWSNYHKMLGFKPLVKVSRPGLNKDKTKAFIYYTCSSDGLSGAGFYLILEKVNDEWIVKESMLAWIS
jgi:hypothetical protein